MPDKNVTSITAWREGRIQEVRLPSGNVARLRRAHILDLAMAGAIPAPLAGLVSEMVSEQKTTIGLDELGKYGQLVDVVVKAAFVEPRVGDESTENQLAISEIDAADKLAVFAWSHPEGEQKMRGFRAKPARVVGAAQHGQHVRPAAQPDSGNQ